MSPLSLSSLAPGVKMRDPGNEVGEVIVFHILGNCISIIAVVCV